MAEQRLRVLSLVGRERGYHDWLELDAADEPTLCEERLQVAGCNNLECGINFNNFSALPMLAWTKQDVTELFILPLPGKFDIPKTGSRELNNHGFAAKLSVVS